MKNERLSDSVYQYLLDMILNMEIKPGDRIPEAKIATQLGISRTPIRDAMLQLANDGIINIYPNRFAEVACWDEERVKQIGVMRIQMDNLAVRLAVHYGSNAEFLQMFDHAILCLEAAKAGDMVTRIKEDCAFHLELSVISKNQYLIDFQRRNYLRIEFLQSWRGGYLETPEEQYRQHEELHEILMARDAKKACVFLTQHNMHFHNLEEEYPIGLFLDE
ncbi:MAG: GntR family transcriptional regulator [Acetivibrionales bacterium]|jgi:DNA-binding GntR family transcriptional regulator